jgi:hypothetical protein
MEEQLQRQNSLLKSLLDKLQRKIALDRRRLLRIRYERDQAVYREVRPGKSKPLYDSPAIQSHRLTANAAQSQVRSHLEDRLHRLTQELADLQGNTDRSYCVIC